MRCVVQFVYGRNKLFKWSVVFLSQLQSVSCKHVLYRNIRCAVSFGVSTTLWSIRGTTCRGTGSGQWSWDTAAQQQLLGSEIKTKGASWWPEHLRYFIFQSRISLWNPGFYSWLLLHSAQFSLQCVFSLQLEQRIIFIINYTANCSPYYLIINCVVYKM